MWQQASGWARWRTSRQSSRRGPHRVGAENSTASGEGGGDRKAGGGAPSVVERKDGTRQVAERTTAVAVDQARFRGCPGLMASRCRVSGVK
jgi:hypothetical protein